MAPSKRERFSPNEVYSRDPEDEAAAKRRRLTPFRLAVLAVCKQVPRGSFTTYGDICKALGRGSPRSVGTALKNNPYAPVVPCHRVLRSDFSIGGFAGQTGRSAPKVVRKYAILRHESLRFGDDGKVAEQLRGSGRYMPASELRAPTEHEQTEAELAHPTEAFH